jgi:hypothetical protein
MSENSPSLIAVFYKLHRHTSDFQPTLGFCSDLLSLLLAGRTANLIDKGFSPLTIGNSELSSELTNI